MPLSLSDDEYNAVRAAAAPIHPLQRDAFLKALAVELERHPVVGRALCIEPPRSCRRPSSWRRIAKRRTPPSRDTSELAGRPAEPANWQSSGAFAPTSANQTRTKGKLGATPSAVGISTRASAQSCSPRPTRSRSEGCIPSPTPAPSASSAEVQSWNTTGEAAIICRRASLLFRLGQRWGHNLPHESIDGVAGMQLVSSVPATSCSKRRASEKARMTTHGALEPEEGYGGRKTTTNRIGNRGGTARRAAEAAYAA